MSQFFKQRLGLLQILRAEPFGEPAVDVGEHLSGLGLLVKESCLCSVLSTHHSCLLFIVHHSSFIVYLSPALRRAARIRGTGEQHYTSFFQVFDPNVAPSQGFGSFMGEFTATLILP
jgi:hypothetical protein